LITFYSTWFELPEPERGSYVYYKTWQTPDHIFLSGGLADQTGFSFSPGSFKVAKLPFLLNEQTGYPLGLERKYFEYSDHLPLLIELMAN
jgi:hypothetical protein